MTTTNLDTLLTQAIDEADSQTLKTILKSIVTTSTESRLAATKLLLVPEPESEESDEDSNDEEDGAPRRKKRKIDADGAKGKTKAMVSRYETCNTCQERFDITVDDEEACRTHDGDLEVDSDYFPDDDDIQAGEYIDTETDWRVAEFPDGFIWNCCEGNAESEPCIVQAHEVSAR